MLRTVARNLGVGVALERISRVRRLGLKTIIDKHRARNSYLPMIFRARPIDVSSGEVEVHMLLCHRALCEGAWAVYSFCHFSPVPCHVIIHDDGSLTPDDLAMLKGLLPGIRVIARATADERVNAIFATNKLERCRWLRDGLVFGLKLFDPQIFATHPCFVIMDSDVLFFSEPKEIILEAKRGSCQPIAPLYSLDNGYRYDLSDSEMRRTLGRPCIRHFNPGVMLVRKDSLNFDRIEQYLQLPCFEKDLKPSYFAELTLWAMELTLQDAVALPDSYCICEENVVREGLVYSHYCGGGVPATYYYTRGLPHLADEFGLSAN
jgi:hypothetical protein